MRTCLACVASLLLASLVACAGEETGGSIGLHRGASSLAEGHDNDPTVGENDVDDGNPNADKLPDAPTTKGASAAQFELAVSDAQPTVDLGGTTDITVTVTPKGAFTGAVALAVTGLPAGTTAAPVTANVAGAPTTAKVTIKADLTAPTTAVNTNAPLKITGTAAGASAVANANFKVAPKLTLTVPMNVDALRAASTTYRDEWGAAFGATQKPLTTQTGNGIVVTVFNADSKQHIIHGANGFAHGNTGLPIDPNAFEKNADGTNRTRTLNVGTNANGYLHEGSNGVGASFRIKIVEGT